MRKDVRFGLTIGAILLAVLIVYVLVVPADRPQQGVQLETLNPDGSPAAPEAGAAGQTLAQSPAADAPAGTDARDGAAAVPAEPELTRTPVVEPSDKVDWYAILNGRSAAAVDSVAAPSAPAASAAPATPAAPRERFIPQPPPAVAGASAAAAAPAEPARTEPLVPRDLPSTPATYKVESGDNFWTISRKVFGDGRYASAIQQANPGANPARLKVGQELKLPDRASLPAASPAPAATAEQAPIDPARQYRVQRGDSLHKIAQRLYGTDAMADDLYQLNQQIIGSDPARLKVGMILQLPESPGTATAGAR